MRQPRVTRSGAARRAPGAILVCCCAALALTGCGTLSTMALDAQDLNPPRRAGSESLQRQVDALVEPLIASGQTPGMVVGVLLPDGSTQFFGYGATERGGERPDADTLFAVGSLSKGFLAAITALLVEDGTLSWDDTLGDLLPPATPLSADARKITLLQLATHTSGLPRQPFNATTLTQFVHYLFSGQSFYRQFNRRFVLDYLADFDAGDAGEPQYSNIGYGLIGHILELRTGLSIDELLERRLTDVLGLACTGYAADELPCYATRAHGHAGDQPKFVRRGKAVPDWRFTHFMRGSAGLHSNARDLLAFAAAHLKGAATPFDAALDDALKVRFARPKEAAALAWIADDVGGRRINYQIGLVAGYTSYIGIDAERGSAVVVLQNSFNWSNDIGHKLLLRLARDTRENGLQHIAINHRGITP